MAVCPCIADMIQWQKILGHEKTASYLCLSMDCDREEQGEQRGGRTESVLQGNSKTRVLEDLGVRTLNKLLNLN